MRITEVIKQCTIFYILRPESILQFFKLFLVANRSLFVLIFYTILGNCSNTKNVVFV